MTATRPVTAAALGLCAALALASPATSQGTSQGANQGAGPTAVTVPLQDPAPADSLGERAGRLWSDLLDGLGFGLGAGSVMRSHGAAAQRQAELRDDFAGLMDLAGYRLREIDSVVGVIPRLGLTFGQARELTEADRDYVERQLGRHARTHGGPMAVLQRTIVRAVLDASEIGGFGVDRVEVEFFPLPKVTFALAPVDAPLGVEAARIMRAIDRLNVRLQTMAPHQQGFDLAPPRTPSALHPVTLTP